MNWTLYHGLRNSISGILSASQSLIDDLPEVQGDHQILIRAIHESSRSMLDLIDDEFMRLEAHNKLAAFS